MWSISPSSFSKHMIARSYCPVTTREALLNDILLSLHYVKQYLCSSYINLVQCTWMPTSSINVLVNIKLSNIKKILAQFMHMWNKIAVHFI